MLKSYLAAALLDVADEMMEKEDRIKNQPHVKQALVLLKKAAEKAMKVSKRN